MGAGTSSKILQGIGTGCSPWEERGGEEEEEEDSKFWNGPPGEHSPFPLDNIPYQGPSLLYCFIDLVANFKVIQNEINLGPNAVTTDLETRLQELADCYNDGLLLNKLVRVPTLKMTTSLEWTCPQPYQAILSRPTFKPASGAVTGGCEQWRIKVVKHILSTRAMPFDQVSKKNNIMTKIEKLTKKGSRLVSVESVGCKRSFSCNTQYGILGVEMFFNVPSAPTSPSNKLCSPRWSYHVVTVPVIYKVIPDLTHNVQQVICEADFAGQLKVFLDSGWKLVDICFDVTSIAEAYQTKATSKDVETIWIFEKETDRLRDDRPLYEGVILEYVHKIKVKGNKEKACKDWRPVIAGMGLSGWELASIIQTPLLIQTSVSTYTMKVLFIFQRPLSKNNVETYPRYEVKVRARPDSDYMDRKMDSKYGSLNSNKTAMDGGCMRGSGNHSSGYMSYRSSLNSQSSHSRADSSYASHAEDALAWNEFKDEKAKLKIRKSKRVKKESQRKNDLMQNIEYLNYTLGNCALEFQSKHFNLTKDDFLHFADDGLRNCR